MGPVLRWIYWVLGWSTPPPVFEECDDDCIPSGLGQKIEEMKIETAKLTGHSFPPSDNLIELDSKVKRLRHISIIEGKRR